LGSEGKEAGRVVHVEIHTRKQTNQGKGRAVVAATVGSVITFNRIAGAKGTGGRKGGRYNRRSRGGGGTHKHTSSQIFSTDLASKTQKTREIGGGEAVERKTAGACKEGNEFF